MRLMKSHMNIWHLSPLMLYHPDTVTKLGKYAANHAKSISILHLLLNSSSLAFIGRYTQMNLNNNLFRNQLLTSRTHITNDSTNNIKLQYLITATTKRFHIVQATAVVLNKGNIWQKNSPNGQSL